MTGALGAPSCRPAPLLRPVSLLSGGAPAGSAACWCDRPRQRERRHDVEPLRDRMRRVTDRDGHLFGCAKEAPHAADVENGVVADLDAPFAGEGHQVGERRAVGFLRRIEFQQKLAAVAGIFSGAISLGRNRSRAATIRQPLVRISPRERSGAAHQVILALDRFGYRVYLRSRRPLSFSPWPAEVPFFCPHHLGCRS